MITKIKTADDVKICAKQLISESVSFHPDDDLNDYVNFKTGISCYSNQQATRRNNLMNQCFAVCSKENQDIYEIMLQVTLKETGMDKFIPVASSH